MKVVGLMSGTSADGIDVAVCDISGAPPLLSVRTLAALNIPFDLEVQASILEACSPDKSRVDKIARLHFRLAEYFASAVDEAVRKAGLELKEIDLIGLHGQTVWHDVAADGTVTATLQITEASLLAELTGVTVISNFRARDVAVGGQGAPLTAYVDWLLLRHPTYWRAIQNIGGMGNVTFLPPLNVSNVEPVAFDTGPGNALIDGVISYLSDGREAFDLDGRRALSGTIDEILLDELLAHPYYGRKPPKTTGRELFGVDMARDLVSAGRERKLNDNDVVATVTMLTAATIADAYRNFLVRPVDQVIIGGGGARNPVLMQFLSDFLDPVPVLTHEDVGLDSDNKEALVFAVLAYETWHMRPGNMPQFTGASRPVVLGQLTPGNNFKSLLEITWKTL